ncbi:GNAT family N-acetyltransferase [Roseibacillus persicicus]|uniref:GNAT family N-acetyltransferase n=1 Tax=Roseibacillus persicicus TaxID=454148 RepID=UPI00398B0A8A
MKPRTPLRHELAELHAMALELAEFEKITHLVKSTPADLERAMFEEKVLEGLVVDAPDGQGLAGFAIFYRNFSSFTGKTELWLEDLYVRPEYRGHGFGRELLDHFLSLAKDRGCGRAEWSVLDWNTSAIEFYQSRQADVMPDWRICRVTFPA